MVIIMQKYPHCSRIAIAMLLDFEQNMHFPLIVFSNWAISGFRIFVLKGFE